MKYILLTLMVLVGAPQLANADVYSCAKMVYKDGWFKKYEYLGNTWGANTKKHGALSSVAGSSVEQTTSSLDPGVTTGNSVSTMQYLSSWGECSMLELHITRQMREEYIDQNMPEIKKQVAIGAGHHVDSLAFVSGCLGIDRETWTKGLQQKTAAFYDARTGKAFADEIDAFVASHSELKAKCRVLL